MIIIFELLRHTKVLGGNFIVSLIYFGLIYSSKMCMLFWSDSLAYQYSEEVAI